MHTVAVYTLSNDLITNVNVATEELDQVVASFAVLMGTRIYIDGRLLPPAQRAHFLRAYREEALGPGLVQASSSNASTSAAPLPSMQEVTSWMDIMRRGLEDISHGFEAVQSAAAQQHQFAAQAAAQQLQNMHTTMKAATEMFLQMQRELADEAVRQRKLTAQSLGDIDLLDRAVKTAQLNDALAKMQAANGFAPRDKNPQTLARRDESFTVGDVLGALTIVNQQQ